jgi:hypothetical protein
MTSTIEILICKNRPVIVLCPDPRQNAAPIIDPDKYTEWKDGEPVLDAEYDLLYR